MKKLLTLFLPILALLTAAAAPQAAFARDGYSTSTTVQVRGDRDDDRDSWRGRGHHYGWNKHCRTVVTQHWSRWQHRMIITRERVCRR
jgi:hypothetical protein